MAVSSCPHAVILQASGCSAQVEDRILHLRALCMRTSAYVCVWVCTYVYVCKHYGCAQEINRRRFFVISHQLITTLERRRTLNNHWPRERTWPSNSWPSWCGRQSCDGRKLLRDLQRLLTAVMTERCTSHMSARRALYSACLSHAQWRGM